MAKKADVCDICGSPYDSFTLWHGMPFRKLESSVTLLCHTCVHVLKPQIIKQGESEIALIGTYADDIYPLSELIEEGFDKDRATRSIRALGKALSIPAKEITKKVRT